MALYQELFRMLPSVFWPASPETFKLVCLCVFVCVCVCVCVCVYVCACGLMQVLAYTCAQ